MKPLKTVIVGFGAVADTLGEDARMARYFTKASHASVLAANPNFDWQAVVDPSEASRARARCAWNIADCVPSLDALESPETYECAVIATPPDSQVAVLDSLPGLKAILLEKPLGPDCEVLARICQQRDIRVQVNYWRRGVVGFRRLAGGGLRDRVGSPRAVFGVYGGGLANTGSHMIDFVRMLLGEVEFAECDPIAEPASDARIAGDFAARVRMRMTSGADISLLPIDFSEYREASLDIWGSKGRLAIEQESLVTRVWPLRENRGLENALEIASDKPEAIGIDVGAAFENIYDNLAAAVSGDEELLSPLSSALVTEAILNEIRGAGNCRLARQKSA